jgi:hypothetical protein
MVAAVKQIATVQRGGVIRLKSPELKAGDRAEVTVRVREPAARRNGAAAKSSTSAIGKAEPVREAPIARMTKQVRGDIAEANRIRAAIREGREKLIPWEQVKRELGHK